MADESADPLKEAAERKVPDELLRLLHLADEQLHKARQSLEKMMAENQVQHQEHIDRANEEVRAAERAVEEVSLRIHNALKPPPTATPGH